MFLDQNCLGWNEGPSCPSDNSWLFARTASQYLSTSAFERFRKSWNTWKNKIPWCIEHSPQMVNLALRRCESWAESSKKNGLLQKNHFKLPPHLLGAAEVPEPQNHWFFVAWKCEQHNCKLLSEAVPTLVYSVALFMKTMCVECSFAYFHVLFCSIRSRQRCRNSVFHF